MNLLEAIVEYGRVNLTPANDWYDWREINLNHLPQGVVLPAGNQYIQNVGLKLALRALYAAGDEQARFELTRYYIVIWGGVKGNKTETLREYALADPEVLIARGSKGVASWSKALCIRNPSVYAIYDARVALALNCLQIAYQVDQAALFPLLLRKSRNNIIIECGPLMRQYALNNQWLHVDEREFYYMYNEILANAANQLGVPIYTLEMLLFSKVLDLCADVFPEVGQ